MTRCPLLELNNVTRSFDNARGGPRGVFGLTHAIHEGDVEVWLGHSGSGKSTTAQIIAGLEKADEGSVLCDGQEIDGLPAHRRARHVPMYYVFQNTSLYPGKRVGAFLRLGPLTGCLDTNVFRSRQREAFCLLFPETQEPDEMEALLRKRPHELSGGERQRIALAKALIIRARLTLLDEPLSNVDAPNRTRIRREIRHMLKRHQMTAVWITHDQEEAIGVADRLAVFAGGRILQVGKVQELETTPCHVDVASFVGSGLGAPLNLTAIDASTVGRQIASKLSAEQRQAINGSDHVVAGVRSIDVDLVASEPGVRGDVSGVVRAAERQADGSIVVLDTEDGHQFTIRTRVSASSVRVGGAAVVNVRRIAFLFDGRTGVILPVSERAKDE